MEKKISLRNLMIIDPNNSRVYEFPYYQLGNEFDIVEALGVVEKFYGYSFNESDIDWVLMNSSETNRINTSKVISFLGFDIRIDFSDTIMDLLLKFSDQDYIISVNSRGEIYYEDNKDKHFVGRVAFDELVFHRFDIVERLQEIING